MELTVTSDPMIRLTWPGGHIVVNLVPMNREAACGTAVGYAAVGPNGVLTNTLADLVGIVGLAQDNCPRVPRICWDNREHHFWDGFEGAFEPRNVVVNAPTVARIGSHTARISYYYIANAVKTQVEWTVRPSDFLDARPVWNTAITVENMTGRTLRNYLLFFACYHQPGQNLYWGADRTLRVCAPGGCTVVADADQEQRLRSSPYHAHSERYRGQDELHYFRYFQPVLVSPTQPWYGNARHVVMVEPAACAAVVTWNQQARDYMLRPPRYDLGPGEAFTAHIRHALAVVDNASDIERLWRRFQADLPSR